LRRRSTSLLGLTTLAVILMTIAWMLPADGARTGRGAWEAAQARPTTCREAALSGGYVRSVDRALRANQDVWGKALLAAPGGPSYARVRGYLRPLFLARAPRGRLLTESGVHYAHFTEPNGAWGATSVALHVADGSAIASERAHGRKLKIRVGSGGRERYGSCLRRLAETSLADGYLPILQTRYTDESGVRYRQESFAARIPETRSLVSFVRIRADARRASAGTTRIRFTPSATGLEARDHRLRRRGRTHLFFSPGGSYNGASVKYTVVPGTIVTAYVAWLHTPSRSDDLFLDEVRYEEALASVRRYWERRLTHGATIVVPEKRVLDAQRNLLIQNLGLTWRYSIGNRYEQFSTPEGIDVARVLAAYGYSRVSRAILHTSIRPRPAHLREIPVRNPNWKMGARLMGFAQQARLSGDLSHVIRATPTLRRYVRILGRQINSGHGGLLERERYSSDVAESVYGLHSQAVVWQGLRSMAWIWQKTGNRALAIKCRRLAARLKTGLRRAVRASQERLSDGTLFVPVNLLDGERPYESLTSSRSGSYWNLVMPYALASGLFPPGSSQATGVLEYMQRHGSRLLGLVRAGAYALYGEPVYPTSGSVQVYGLNVARFLADNDQPDELVLSLYGQLAAAMTPGTFVSGEGASITPLAGDHYRSMYLPPNGASNAAFLETLRLMLVHETMSRRGAPLGLELAYSTPRRWLKPGKHIEVQAMPTSFGRISFAIDVGESYAHVSLDVPQRASLRNLRLRLRFPDGKRIRSVLLDGRRYRRFDPETETIRLPPRAGLLELDVNIR
jgi:hypothetical protein